MPVKYSDLPRNAVLAFTIWDLYAINKHVPVGGTTISLFGKYGYVGAEWVIKNFMTTDSESINMNLQIMMSNNVLLVGEMLILNLH